MKRWTRRILLLAALLALLLTGCSEKKTENPGNGETVTKSGEEGAAAVDPKQQNTEAEKEEESYPLTDTGTQPEGRIRVATADGIKYYDSVEDIPREEPSEELVKAALEALKDYFDVTVDREKYEISTSSMAEEVYEGDLYKANTTIRFTTMENRNEQGFFLGEYIKPEYSVSFLENGEIKDIYLSGMKTVWGDAQKPPTVEEAKRLTRQFLISAKLFEEKDIELLGAGYSSDLTIAAVYKDGEDGAVVVAVDVGTGRVDCFDRLSTNRALKWITPIEAGSGVG